MFAYYNVIDYKSVFKKQLQKYNVFIAEPKNLIDYSDYCYSEKSINLVEKYSLSKYIMDNEIETCKYIARWVYEKLYYKTVAEYYGDYNALSVVGFCEENKVSVNCAMHAIVLMESLLGVGISSKCVQCLPWDPIDDDSHFLVLAYIKELDKEIAIDPSYSLSFTVGNTFANILELRNSIVSDMHYEIHRFVRFKTQLFDEKWYRAYMTKNLFRFSCPQRPSFTYGNNEIVKMFYLEPVGYGIEGIINKGNIEEIHSCKNTIVR